MKWFYIFALVTLFSADSTQAGESDSLAIYGKWRWTETSYGALSIFTGTPEACDCERYLEFRRDGTYEYVEQDTAHEYVLSHGSFRVARVTMGLSEKWLRYYWVSLAGGADSDNRVMYFPTQDSLILRPCGPGGEYATDGGGDSYIRAHPHREPGPTPGRVRLPLNARPPRNDTVVSVDTTLAHSPVLLLRTRPEYPESLKQAHVEGKVGLRLLVGRDGKVKKVDVTRGVGTLNQLAIDAAQQWTFTPFGGWKNPQAAWIQVDIQFPPTE